MDKTVKDRVPGKVLINFFYEHNLTPSSTLIYLILSVQFMSLTLWQIFQLT